MTNTNTNTTTTKAKAKPTPINKATPLDLERLSTWGDVMAALEALQGAYTATAAECDALVAAGKFAATARAVRDDLGDAIKSLEVNLWRNAKSSGLTMPAFITI
jgi:hypothetical protein